MTRNEIIEEILGIMDEMSDEAENGIKPDMRLLELDDRYSIAVEADFTVDHIDSWKIYLKEDEEYLDNITYYETQDDVPILKQDIGYLLDLASVQ